LLVLTITSVDDLIEAFHKKPWVWPFINTSCHDDTD